MATAVDFTATVQGASARLSTPAHDPRRNTIYPSPIKGLSPGDAEFRLRLERQIAALHVEGSRSLLPTASPRSGGLLAAKQMGVRLATPHFTLLDLRAGRDILPRNQTHAPRTTPISTASRLTKNIETGVPLVPANMQTVALLELGLALKAYKMPTIAHRYHGLAAQIDYLTKMDGYAFGCVGTRNLAESIAEARKLLDLKTGSPVLGICIEVTHGDCFAGLRILEALNKSHPDRDHILGNICTYYAAVRAVSAGAKAVKDGMGPGSPCTTRAVTRVGVPQASAISSTADACEPYGIPVIGDAGIRTPEDFKTALLCGASTTMSGQAWARCWECMLSRLPPELQQYRTREELTPKLEAYTAELRRTHGRIPQDVDVKFEDGKIWVRYFGEASAEARRRRATPMTPGTVPEGDMMWVEVDRTVREYVEAHVQALTELFDLFGVSSVAELHAAVKEAIPAGNLAAALEMERAVDRSARIELIGGQQTRAGSESDLSKLLKEVPSFDYLARRVEERGPLSPIELPFPRSRFRRVLETDGTVPTAEYLDFHAFALGPDFAREDLASRKFVDVTTKLTTEVRSAKPILPLSSWSVMTDALVKECLDRGVPPILPPESRRPATCASLEHHNPWCIPTFMENDADVVAKMIQAIDSGSPAVAIEVDQFFDNALLTVMEVKKQRPGAQIIFGNVETYSQTCRAIAAGATGIKAGLPVGVQRESVYHYFAKYPSATVLAECAAAAAEFNIPVIAVGDIDNSAHSNLAIALGANAVMTPMFLLAKESAFAGAVREVPDTDDKPGGTERFYESPTAPAGSPGIWSHETDADWIFLHLEWSLRSSSTLQGCGSIEEIHEAARDGSVVLRVRDGYVEESKVVKLLDINVHH